MFFKKMYVSDDLFNHVEGLVETQLIQGGSAATAIVRECTALANSLPKAVVKSMEAAKSRSQKIRLAQSI